MDRKPKAASREKQADHAQVKSQTERFKETARKLGVDETGEALERAFKKIVPPKQRVKGGR
jgi:hypothetical protein